MPAHEFLYEGEWALGTAQIIDGQRVIHVATGNQSALDVATTLVHEAGHLEIYSRTGVMSDQAYAESLEPRFIEDFWNSRQRKPDMRETEAGSAEEDPDADICPRSNP